MTFPKSQRGKGRDRLFKTLADFFYFRLKTRNLSRSGQLLGNYQPWDFGLDAGYHSIGGLLFLFELPDPRASWRGNEFEEDSPRPLILPSPSSDFKRPDGGKPKQVGLHTQDLP